MNYSIEYISKYCSLGSASNIRLASYENGQISKELYFSEKKCFSSNCTMRKKIPSFDTIYTTPTASTNCRFGQNLNY